MNAGLIASRYATALMEFATANNAVDAVYAQAKSIINHPVPYRQIRGALENPSLKKEDKKKIILLAAGNNASDIFNRFTDLLLDNNREGYLQTILLKFIDLYRDKNGIHHAKLTTAAEPDPKTEKRVIELVGATIGGKVELERKINADILGGFLLEVDGRLFDASIHNQLKRIKTDYIEKNKSIL